VQSQLFQMPVPASTDEFLDLLVDAFGMTKPAGLAAELIDNFLPWGVLKKRTGVLVSSLHDKPEAIKDAVKSLLTEMKCSTTNALTVNKLKKFFEVSKSDVFRDKLNANLRVITQNAQGVALDYTGDEIRLEGLFDTVFMQYTDLKNRKRLRHDEELDDIRKQRATLDANYETELRELKEDYAVVADYAKLDDVELASEAWRVRYDGLPQIQIPNKSQSTIDDAIRVSGSTASRKHKLKYVRTPGAKAQLLERGKDIVELLKSDFRVKRAKTIHNDLTALGVDMSDVSFDVDEQEDIDE